MTDIRDGRGLAVGNPNPVPMRVSQLLAVAGVVLIGAVGTIRFFKNGSFWMDEASIALNLLHLGPLELFGRLELNQNFPRLYLLLIYGTAQAFGFETEVLRFFPYLFFLLATILWQRLLYLRFRGLPILLTVAILLSLMSTTWFVHSSMLKQYSFDVFLALIPFAVSDALFKRTLRDGQRSWGLLALTVPCAASYTYALILLGRLAGWYVGELKYEGLRLDPRGTGILLIGLLAFSFSLWLTDFRTAGTLPYLFWQNCILGEGWSESLQLIAYLAVGFYTWALIFHQVEPISTVVIITIQVASALGLARIALDVFRKANESPATLQVWGTRSVGSVFCVSGVLLAAVLLQYPICAGRLMLFVLPCLLIITLEGLDLVYQQLGKLPWGGFVAPALGLVLIASLAPVGLQNALSMSREDVPQNIRTVMHHIGERGALPVLVSSCMKRQVESLPEGLGPRSVQFLDRGLAVEKQLPWGEEVLLLGDDRPALVKACSDFEALVLEHSTSWKVLHSADNTVSLFLLKFPEEPNSP